MREPKIKQQSAIEQQSRLNDEKLSLNQTHFREEIPLIEKRKEKMLSLSSFKNKNLAPFYILAGLLFLFLSILLFSLAKRISSSPEEKVNEAFVVDDKVDPLAQRVLELKASLKDADPTRQTLPFPQIDLKFSMD